MEMTYWRKCGCCKKEIGFNTVYQACTVSSCNKQVFCSMDCWSQHNPVMNHKNPWAEERVSPRKEEVSEQVSSTGVRRMVVPQKSGGGSSSSDLSSEVLIVASKLKQYVKDKHDMNTAASVMDALTMRVRHLTDQAVDKAKRDGRKTLMDRDFQ